MRSIPLLALALTSVFSSVSCVDDSCDSEETCTDDAGLMEQAFTEAQTEGKADGTDCSGVRVPDRSNFGKHVVLTFDDGPNPATTPKVIAVLKKHHAPATFFNNGVRYNSQAAKDIAAQIAADPQFILANHSQNHLNLATLSSTKVATEIDKTDALIRAAGETPKYFRFPFGSASCSGMKQVHDRGYISVGWHIDSADWCYAAGNGTCKKSTFQYVPDNLRTDMLGYIVSQVKANNGGVMLMHDIHQSTADHLDEILTTLEAQGFTFARLDDTAVLPKLNGVMPAPAPFIGDKCLTDAQCGFTAGGQAGRCHPAGFCTTTCAGSCPDLDGRAGTFCIAESTGTGAGISGICVAKAATQNQQCVALTGTAKRDADRYVGASGAAAARATVCAPR